MKIKEAFPEDMERIFPLLYDEFGLGRMSSLRLERQKSSFERLFLRNWRSEKKHIGYYFEENNQIAGFMGYIFSERQIGEKLYKFCNLSAWAVRKESRSMSISLSMPVKDLKDEGYTITNLLPSLPASNVFRKLHCFKELETHFVLIPYIPSFSKTKSRCISFDDNVELSCLSENERKNCEDARRFGASVAVLKKDSGICAVIFKQTYYKRYIPVSGILRVSDPVMFTGNIQLFRSEINRHLGTTALMTDLRFTGGSDIKYSIKMKMHNPRLFWSESLENVQIDNLYSENLL